MMLAISMFKRIKLKTWIRLESVNVQGAWRNDSSCKLGI